jgi:nitroreductase
MGDEGNRSTVPRGLAELRAILLFAPAALSRISEEESIAKASPEQWSLKEELGHLIDSAQNNHRRLVLGQIEDHADLPGHDSKGWIAAHGYQARDWNELIQSWEFFNNWLLSVADRVPESGWKRKAKIGENEDVTLGFVIDDYVDHLQHHLEHIGVKVDPSSEGTRHAYPEKPAEVESPIADLLARRWSTVAFDEARPVERGKIMSLLEAARWAPSCFNEQPWRYLVFDGSNPDAREQARDCLVEGNAWARGAPLLLLSVAYEDFTASGKPNRHAQHDTGMASENIVVQAVELGLSAHQMAGYDADRAQQVFQIPDRFTSMAMIAIGYPYRGKIEDLSEKVRGRESRPRSRKGISEIAFDGKWGKLFGG